MRIDHRSEYCLWASGKRSEYWPAMWRWMFYGITYGLLLLAGCVVSGAFWGLGLRHSVWIGWLLLAIVAAYALRRYRRRAKAERLKSTSLHFRLEIGSEGIMWERIGFKAMRFHWSLVDRVASRDAGLLFQLLKGEKYIIAPAEAFTSRREQDRVATVSERYRQDAANQSRRFQINLTKQSTLPTRFASGEWRFRRSWPVGALSWRPNCFCVFGLLLCGGALALAFLFHGAPRQLLGGFALFLAIVLALATQVWLVQRLRHLRRRRAEEEFVVLAHEGVVIGDDLSDAFFPWTALAMADCLKERIEFLHYDDTRATSFSKAKIGSEKDVEEFLAIVREYVPVRMRDAKAKDGSQ